MLVIKTKWKIKANHSLVQIHKKLSIRKDLEVHKVVKDKCMVHQCIRDYIKVHLPSKEQ